MTKTKKVLIGIGVLCLAAFVIGKFVSYRKAEKLKEQTAYALAHAPVEAKYMKHPAEYARQYVFAKVPPAGEFYEDENYRFQLLQGMTVKRRINGFAIFSRENRSEFWFEEFSSWNDYLDYEQKIHVIVFWKENLKPVFHYDAPFVFESLTPEAYGAILPDGKISYKLKSGESVLEMINRDRGYHGMTTIGRRILIKKVSGHILLVSHVCPDFDGQIARISETALRLALDTLTIKNQTAFAGISINEVLKNHYLE